MANINSISSNSYSSSTSSLYGNRNVLTGLASGMDTEAMIQNSVAGYQTKITQLEQSVTKLEWKQDAYRTLTDQMYNINQKYMSYTSKTNLSSNSFFTNATTTTTQGTNAAAITATGRAKSDIQINAVTQLATSARYAIDASALSVAAASKPTGTTIDWSKSGAVGQVKGTMTLKYGSQSIDLKFDESDDDINSADKLKKAIEKKLADIDVTTSKGTVKASNLFSVKVDGNKFTFEENRNSPADDGSSVYINSVSGNIGAMLGASKPSSTENTVKFANDSFTVGNFDKLVSTPSTAEYLSGKTVDVTLDGVTKQIKLGDLTGAMPSAEELASYDAEVAAAEERLNAGDLDLDESAQAKTAYSEALGKRNNFISEKMNAALQNDLQTSIDKQFGKGKVTVAIKDGALDFSVAEGSGSTLKVSSEAGERLGIGKSGVSNYFNTSKTLQNLLGTDWLDKNARMKAADGPIGDAKYYDSDGNQVKQGADGRYYQIDSKGNFKMSGDDQVAASGDVNALRTDSEGNLVRALYSDGEGEYYRVNAKGEFLYGLEINGTTLGGFTEDTSLESVINTINSNADAGVNVSYSNLTSQFVFTARETGEGGKISFDNALAQKLFTAETSNAPADKKVQDLFGDSIAWDEKGYAFLTVNTPEGSELIGKIHKDDSVQYLMKKLNRVNNSYIQNRFSYDETSGTYQLLNSENKEASGTEAGKVSIGVFGNSDTKIDFNTILQNANAMPGFTAGTDAVIDATVNGKQLSLKRSSNVVNMDGMTVTLKEEFSAYGTDGKLNKADAVTFKTSSNADDIVDTVRSFVEDINKLMNDVHSAYATQPAEKNSSKHTKYEPLTEDDKKDMSESAVAAYEEKAKQGLLFGDTDLSTLYNKLRDAIQSFGSDRVDMESIGLSTTYSNGVTQLSFNENKMRAALDSDPDKVKNVFTKTKEGGSATNGLMATLKSTVNAYASTSIGSPGILVRKAGTKLSSLSLLNNNIQKQIDNVNTQIESWQTKLSSKIDYYTKQFTALEKLMSTMNNQSSMLADLMGY